MKLTEETIFQYLYKKKLVNNRSVVKGDFVVHPVKTRNYNMKILINEEESLFVKQMEMDVVSTNLFNREVYTYQLFNTDEAFSSISKYAPSLLAFDDENNIMVTELIFNSKNLTEYYMLTKKFDLNLAKEQANIISECHIRVNNTVDTSIYPKTLPWVLQLDKYEAHQFFANNEFSTKIIKLIKENRVLQNELIKLANSWQYTHLIHGDIKWINFLIIESENRTEQKLIDWELADIGDPLWDVAGLLQSYLTTWLLGFDNNNPYCNELPEYNSPFDINLMQPSAKHFLYNYLKFKEYAVSEYNFFFTKTIQLTAARIIQTCVEGVTYNSKIEANTMRSVQLAFNILKNPEYALESLFDIKTHSYV